MDETLAVGGRWPRVWAQNWVPGEVRTGGLIAPTEALDLVDLFALHEYSGKHTFAVNLNNVLDQDYAAYRQFDPEPGFSAAVSGAVKLGG